MNRIKNGKICRNSMKYTGANAKEWTTACKGVLQVLQWMLVKCAKFDKTKYESTLAKYSPPAADNMNP